MNIVMINGSRIKESSYSIGKIFINKIKKKEDTIEEFFLPDDLPKFCDGCNKCIFKMEDKCPHYKYTKVLSKVIDEADILVFTSPVYSGNMSGQMKVFLDHYRYRWMVHRPRKNMFKKQAIIITTSLQESIKHSNKGISKNLFNWGIGAVYSYQKKINSYSWEEVSLRDKELIGIDMRFIADKVLMRKDKKIPSFKTKLIFYYTRMLHNRKRLLNIDRDYWDRQGWLGSDRPWDKKS